VDERVQVAGAERAVAVHHARDPGAEAVEQDRAGGLGERAGQVVLDLDRAPLRAAAGLVGCDPLAHLRVGGGARGEVGPAPDERFRVRALAAAAAAEDEDQAHAS
jgi:hypothetical protein